MFIKNLVISERSYQLFSTSFFIRNHFIRNLALDSLKFKKLLELQGKRYGTFDKLHIEVCTWFNVKLYQNNVNMKFL